MQQHSANRCDLHRGFTLIEIALVLIIVGLLLGVILRGQELMKSARIRELVLHQDGITAAYLGFHDRFRAPPGDYARASVNISGVTPGADGNGNGLIESTGSGGAIDEYVAVWEHLSKAKFITGTYTYAPAPETSASAPTNLYGRYLRLIYDNSFGNSTTPTRHNQKTGNMIRSDILAEIDRKIDDGNPTRGIFQFSNYNGGGMSGNAPNIADCVTTSGDVYVWVVAPVAANCGAARLH